MDRPARLALLEQPRRAPAARRQARVRPATARTTPCPTFSRPPARRLDVAAKRSLDVVVAGVLLVLALPVFAIVALAIKIDSRGPVFFGQVRVGRDLRQFRIWKFRSMRVGAEGERDALQAHNEAAHPLFKLADDPRVTRVGRLLRRWSIDELPQLWNVVRGDMSLVGPRPPLPSEVDADGLRQPLRLHVRPGVTGPWQVNGRIDLPYADGVALDIAYVREWSLARDLGILARTPWAVLSKRGAY